MELNKEAVITTLNRIMELELAGVVRYTHYALMVYGYNRIPIVGWMSEVQRVTAEDALAFRKKYYVPSNAVGVLVGT